MDFWNKQCDQGSHTSWRTSSNLINKLSHNQAVSSDDDMDMKTKRYLFYMADIKYSFFIGNTMKIVKTDVFLLIMRTWHLICKYTVVFEHSGLAGQPWVSFWECKTCCVDTSWPPESSMHPARGTFGSTSTSLKVAGCPALQSLQPGAHVILEIVFQQNSLIYPINSNSGLVPLPFRMWDLVYSGGRR